MIYSNMSLSTYNNIFMSKMWSGPKLRVKLKIDLTKYHPSCIVGAEGYIIPGLKTTKFGHQDRFGAVQFDNGVLMDVLINELDFLESYKDKMNQGYEEKRYDEINQKNQKNQTAPDDNKEGNARGYIRTYTDSFNKFTEEQQERFIKLYCQYKNFNLIKIYRERVPINFDRFSDKIRPVLKEMLDDYSGTYKYWETLIFPTVGCGFSNDSEYNLVKKYAEKKDISDIVALDFGILLPKKSEYKLALSMRIAFNEYERDYPKILINGDWGQLIDSKKDTIQY